MAQSVGAIEYTGYVSAQGKDPPKEGPVAQLVGAIEYTGYNSEQGKTLPKSVLWPSRLGL